MDKSSIVKIEQNNSPSDKVGAGNLMSVIIEALRSDNDVFTELEKLNVQLSQIKQTSYCRYFHEELLGKSPDVVEQAFEPAGNPSDMIIRTLISDDFIDIYPKLFLNHFAHLERELFIHVQKMGGTTVLNSFRSSQKVAQILLPDFIKNGWIEDRLLFLSDTLRWLSRPSVRSVIVTGHLSSSYIIRNSLKRGLDRVFMTIRDPVSTSISYVNFVLTLLADGVDNPGVRFWRNELGMSADERPSAENRLQSLASKIVEALLPANSMCSMVGMEPTCASAIACAGILDCQFIDIKNIDAYCKKRELPAPVRENVSKKLVDFDSLNRQSRIILYDKITEDLKFFDFSSRYTEI